MSNSMFPNTTDTGARGRQRGEIGGSPANRSCYGYVQDVERLHRRAASNSWVRWSWQE